MPAQLPSRLIAVAAALIVVGGVGVAMYRSSDDDTGTMFPDKDFQFGEAVQGKPVEHAFTVRNNTDRDVVIRRISPFGPVSLVRADSIVRPGRTGRIHLRFDTQRRHGAVLELANVYTADDSVRPAATLRMRGNVVRPLQLSPQDRVYFFATAGERERRDVEVINHRARPLRVVSATSDNPMFSVQYQPLEAGKRYRVSVTLDPRAPVGKHQGRIVLRTDSPPDTAVPIIASALVDHQVRTSPKTVDFSTIPLGAVDRPVVGEKQVLITKRRGTDFRVLRVSTDLPFLGVATRPHKAGESALVTVRIQKERIRRGQIRGTLTIETNDPAFPQVKVPIVGNVV